MVKQTKSKRSLLLTTIVRKQRAKGNALSSFSEYMIRNIGTLKKSVLTKVGNTVESLKGNMSSKGGNTVSQ